MIPRVLHQTWKTHALPFPLFNLQRSWADSGLQIILWTDVGNRLFVLHHYPKLLRIYDGFPFDIQRVDLVRYLYLYRYGGWYADLDCELTCSTDRVDPKTPQIANPPRLDTDLSPFHRGLGVGVHLFYEDCPVPCLGNALMASSPGHPLWRHVIATLVAGLGTAVTQAHVTSRPTPAQRAQVLNSTGPYMLTRAVQSYEGTGLHLHSQEEYEALVTHHRLGTWWV